MAGFYAPNSGWLSTWGLGTGLLEQIGNLSLVVPWFDISRLLQVVARLPFCPTLPILTKTTFINIVTDLIRKPLSSGKLFRSQC